MQLFCLPAYVFTAQSRPSAASRCTSKCHLSTEIQCLLTYVQVFDSMDRKAGTNHSFQVQIWRPRGLDPEQPNQPAIFLGHATPGTSAPTIMLRDPGGCLHSLSDVAMRFFMPPGQGLRTQEWYNAQPQALEGLGPYQRMRMHVQGVAVPDADPDLSSHPWCRSGPVSTHAAL